MKSLLLALLLQQEAAALLVGSVPINGVRRRTTTPVLYGKLPADALVPRGKVSCVSSTQQLEPPLHTSAQCVAR